MINDLSIDTIKQFASMFGASPFIDQMLSSILGGNAANLGVFGYQNNRTLETNIRNAQRNAELHAFFNTTRSRIAQESVQRAATGFYRLMGYDSQAAASAAESGSALQSVLGWMTVEPEVRSASAAIGGALYDQRGLWDATYPTMAGTNAVRDPMYMRNARWLMESVMTDAAAGKFAGMGIRDTGSLAASMIRAGRYGGYVNPNEAARIGIGDLDAAAFQNRGPDVVVASDAGRADAGLDVRSVQAGRSLASQQARVNAFKRELNEYAAAVNSLRDVIDGPFEQVMESFEKLTGNKLVSVSSGRVGMITGAMRAVLQNGELDTQALATLSTRQYSMLAPLGVDRNTAMQLSLVTAAGLAGGQGIEGVSDIDYGEGQARLNVRNMLNGTYRNAAAAYAHWLQKNNRRASSDSFAAFSAEIGRNTDFNTGVQQYLNSNQVSAEFYRSAAVDSAMRTPQLIAEANASVLVPQFNQERDRILTQMRPGDKAWQNQVRTIIQQTKDPAELQNRLVASGLVSDSDMAASIVNQLQSAAIGITGEANGALAMNMVQRAADARNLLMEQQAAGIWSGVRGQLGGQTGLNGVITALTNAADGKTPMGLGILMQSAFGLDPNRVNEVMLNSQTKDHIAALKRLVYDSTGMSEGAVNQMFTDAAATGAAGTVALTARARTDLDSKIVGTRRAAILSEMSKGQLTTDRLQELLASPDAYDEEVIQLTTRQKNRLILTSSLRAGAKESDQIGEITEQQLDMYEKHLAAVKEDTGNVRKIDELNFDSEQGTRELNNGEISELATIRLKLENRLKVYRANLLKSTGKRATREQEQQYIAGQTDLIGAHSEITGEDIAATGNYLASIIGKKNGLEAIVEEILELLRGWRDKPDQRPASQPK